MVVTRYADDLVIGFERRADAHRFLEMMRKRFEEFALSLHPEKTRLIEFGRYAVHNREQHDLGKPETFNFLGFTLICGRTRRGIFQLKRKTRRDRSRAKLQEIKEELRRRRHYPIPQQGHGAMASASGQGFLRLSRRADKHAGARDVQTPCD